MVQPFLAAAIIAAIFVNLTHADTLKIAAAASKIEFIGKKKDGQHSGGFKLFTGTIDLPGGDLAKGKIELDIRTDSIFSDNDRLTTHLKSPDFFNVIQFPKASFTSTGIKSVKMDNATTHIVTGNLTLHGVTKSLQIPVGVSKTDNGVHLSGQFTLQRKDFGMIYGEGLINNDVKVTLSIKATK